MSDGLDYRQIWDEQCAFCSHSPLHARDCEVCGGQGFRSYMDAPEEWGEDCPGLADHLIDCHECCCTGVECWCPKCGKDQPVKQEPENPCPCTGTCEECGTELKGMALLGGADDDGRPEWSPDPKAWRNR